MAYVFSGKGLACFLVLALTLSLGASAAELEVSELEGIKNVEGVRIDDLENDQQKELIVNTKDYVYVLDNDGGIRWSSQVRSLKSVHVSDIDSDGYKEVLVSSGEVFNKVERGNLYIFDRHGGIMRRYEYEIGKYYPQFIYNDMSSTDIDDDRYKEIIVACSTGVYAIKDTFEVVRWGFKTNDSVLGVRIINSTGNKSSPILANSFYALYALSMNGTFNREYRIDEGIIEVRAAEIYPDPGEEILLVTNEERIHILGNDLSLKVKKTGANGLKQVEVVDLDGDNVKEFAVAGDRQVQVLDNRLNEYGRRVVDGPIKGLFAAEWDGEGEKEIVYSSGRTIYWIDKYGELLGNYSVEKEITMLVVDDLDLDRYVEVIAFTDEKVYVIENTLLKTKNAATEYYAEALGFVSSGKYLAAKKSLAKAIQLYGEIGDEKSINLCRDLEREIESASLDEGIKEAESYCEAAAGSLAAGDLIRTQEYLEEARNAYLDLNVSVKSSKCDEVYLNMSRKQEEAEKTTQTTIIKGPSEINLLQVLNILLLVFILSGLVFYIAKRRK